jgi:hypothetical protein
MAGEKSAAQICIIGLEDSAGDAEARSLKGIAAPLRADEQRYSRIRQYVLRMTGEPGEKKNRRCIRRGRYKHQRCMGRAAGQESRERRDARFMQQPPRHGDRIKFAGWL